MLVEKSTCISCDYTYPVSDMKAGYVHQYGAQLLCKECHEKYAEEGENND